jgi:small multidrug resistance family-3 protein
MLNMFEAKTIALFAVTAVAEIVGCYLPLLWLRNLAPAWVLIPAMLSLGLFVWLLSLHPFASGRVYAAYGGVYVAAALCWLWLVDGIRPTVWDITGVTITLIGMAVIAFGPRHA